jgi:hypothetical protein
MVSEPLSSQRSSMANPNPTTPKFMPNVTQLGSIKLEGPNYLGWVAQLQPILCGYDLQGLLYGSEPCPPQLIANATGDAQIPNLAYVSWLRRDQQLLNLIICSLAPSLVPSMYGLKTSRLAGSNLATWFAATSRSRISHLKRQLQGLQQGNKTCSEYLNQAKTWADELSAISEPVDDDDLISSHSSSMASIQLSTPSSLLSPFMIEKHHFMIFNLNSSAMKSCSKINTPLHLKLAPLLSMLTAPYLHTPTIPTSENQNFSQSPLASTVTPRLTTSFIILPFLHGIVPISLHDITHYCLLLSLLPSPPIMKPLLLLQDSILPARYAAKPVTVPRIASIAWTLHTKGAILQCNSPP